MTTALTREMLRAAGAAEIEHPGGTLLAHLKRVGDLLVTWGGRSALVSGLCHAFYGTDGFATALPDLERRAELAEAIGAEAEELVYFYAAELDIVSVTPEFRARYGAGLHR